MPLISDSCLDQLFRNARTRAIALDSSYQMTTVHLLDALSVSGRTEEMLAVAHREVEHHPGPN